MKKRVLVEAALVLTVALAAGGCAGGQKPAETTAAPATEAETTAAQTEAVTEEATEAEGKEETEKAPSEATDTAYLDAYFDVQIADTPDAAAFSADLKKVAGEAAPDVEGELSWLSAVKAAVQAADYEELAVSYPEEKTAERLKEHGIADGPAEDASYLACAMDVDLITEEDGRRAAEGEDFRKEDEERLLMRVAESNGDGRNYLGLSSDPDIYGKVDQAWNSFLLFDDGRLSEVGKQSVQQQITTGYGIKSAAYDARFLPELTLQYGHSDIKHAHQLLGLLNSENIEALVQLEPKISIYQYLLEWGPIPESTPTYEVKQFDDDLYLVYAVEYDMQLEFRNTEDLMRFDEVINKYAKKNEGNEEAKGLIYESWWQPLYSTVRTDMPEAEYKKFYDCVVTNGIYSIHPFTTPEKLDDVTAKLTELADGLDVEAKERYCNTAFYEYLTGEDYQ